jgi:hypothetical protein
MFVGVLLLLLLSVPFIVNRFKNALVASRNATNQIMLSIARANEISYGLVESVDVDGTHLIMTLYNPFTEPTRQLRVRIEPSAYVAFQELRGNGGVYDTLSEPRKAAASELRPGDRVAILLARDESGTLWTNYIVFGEPL